jgi:hypothetical protein
MELLLLLSTQKTRLFSRTLLSGSQITGQVHGTV